MSEPTLINALVVSTDPMMVFCAKAAIVSMTTIVVMIAILSVHVVWDMVMNWYERWSYTRKVLRARKEGDNE